MAQPGGARLDVALALADAGVVGARADEMLAALGQRSPLEAQLAFERELEERGVGPAQLVELLESVGTGALASRKFRRGLRQLGLSGSKQQLKQVATLLERQPKAGPSAAWLAPYPLHAACLANALPRVLALLRAGADRDSRIGEVPRRYSWARGRTPLMTAARAGHAKVVAALLQAGVGVDLADEVGDTALMQAAGAGHLRVVQLLVDVGHAKVERVGPSGVTAFMAAARRGHVPVVRYLGECGGADVNHADRANWTAMAYAESNGHAAAVRALAALGADMGVVVDGKWCARRGW